jgi:hypothetical protein
MENFDEGGANVGYKDLSTGNDGGKCRSGVDVDVEASNDAGLGCNLSSVKAFEWVNYTVNVLKAGTYDIEVRVASPGTGGTFHIEVNGVDKTGPVKVPFTGGWQTWTTVRRSGVALAAGQQVWRVVMDANGATGSVGNINWIRVAVPVVAAIEEPPTSVRLATDVAVTSLSAARALQLPTGSGAAVAEHRYRGYTVDRPAARRGRRGVDPVPDTLDRIRSAQPLT